MTFEEYLKENTTYVSSYDTYLADYQIKDIIKFAELWHTRELKSMRAKGANTTNTKYSKEQRSEWARRGTKARLQRKLNK